MSMQNSFQLPATLVRFYQQQQQQQQLQQQQQQQQQQQIMQQSQQYYIFTQNCDDEDLDDTNRIENSFINENKQYFESVKSSRLIIKLKVH